MTGNRNCPMGHSLGTVPWDSLQATVLTRYSKTAVPRVMRQDIGQTGHLGRLGRVGQLAQLDAKPTRGKN